MCGCKRRRAARAAWLEQRAARGGGECGRRFGPGYGPPFRPPFMGGPFGRWRDSPRNDVPGDPSQFERVPSRDVLAVRDIEKAKAPQPDAEPAGAGRVSFMPNPFSRWRESVRSDAKTGIKRESTATMPPRYSPGVPEAPAMNGEKPAGMRESLPPTYDAATRH